MNEAMDVIARFAAEDEVDAQQSSKPCLKEKGSVKLSNCAFAGNPGKVGPLREIFHNIQAGAFSGRPLGK